MAKYKAHFNRDFNWYLSMRNKFTFDGEADYVNKKGENIIQYDPNGVDGKKAFFDWDSKGKIQPTRHPNILHTILKVKGSVNLHIKQYAEDRVRGTFPFIEFRALCIKLKAPYWFREAVENQKTKYLRDPNFEVGFRMGSGYP